jgi:hypothetical protein
MMNGHEPPYFSCESALSFCYRHYRNAGKSCLSSECAFPRLLDCLLLAQTALTPRDRIEVLKRSLTFLYFGSLEETVRVGKFITNFVMVQSVEPELVRKWFFCVMHNHYA